MVLSFLHVAVYHLLVFVFIVVLVLHSTEWLYHNLLIHSPVDGHFGCSQFEAIMTKVVMTILI